ncbi:MAG: hypothetical protein BJ554DRAFT_6678 [Olpidium bornovanus]|uniref:Uncharacterized protein n=1 Tax=Olpidium bornovanus TaxID=278681 RepID=A0A8H7ZXA9_9FUNG|nr:MAG: hypothetical protein BJ554DRAFT_6678 [Olpidium bornovanus]
MAFLLPTQILHYALAAAVVGAATAPRRKRGWRSPLVAALFVAAAVDLYLFLDGEGALMRELPCSLPTKVSLVRHGLFAFFALAVAAARGRDDVRTDAEIVAALCERERSFLYRNQASSLLHEAINGDSNLRKSQNSHCLRRELERNLLAADEEVVSAKETAKQRLDLAKATADVAGFVEHVVRAGTGAKQTGDLTANSWR